MKEAWDCVRVICKRKSKWKKWLPRELGFSSYVTASVTFQLSVKMCRR